MKTIKNFILALAAWAMMSVSALAVDIIVVSHGQANDPFWSVAKNGVDAGCKDMGVSCKYTAPATFDMVEMAKLIDNAVSQKPIGFCDTALSINFAISTMSKVAGAVYLQDTPMSLHPASTPFLATDQKGSFA